MIRIAIAGACGRMGITLGRVILGERDLVLAAAIEAESHQALGRDYGLFIHGREIEIKVSSGLNEKVDVLIDFSSPSGAIQRLSECLSFGVPIVIGTTGFSEKQIEQIKKASRKIACFFSPNMSAGANLLMRFSSEIAERFRDPQVEIIETHHLTKKDAPSGTAKEIARRIQASVSREVQIHSIRGGDLMGEHTVIFLREGEVLKITHTITSREVYAKGALAAARFLIGAKPGFYTMDDLF
jgi:4-hydroxy-tetrahydrodipicolinate reductase